MPSILTHVLYHMLSDCLNASTIFRTSIWERSSLVLKAKFSHLHGQYFPSFLFLFSKCRFEYISYLIFCEILALQTAMEVWTVAVVILTNVFIKLRKAWIDGPVTTIRGWINDMWTRLSSNIKMAQLTQLHMKSLAKHFWHGTSHAKLTVNCCMP